MENLMSCPICSGSSTTPLLKSKDYFLSGEEFFIEQCATCGFLFTNPRPGIDEIARYYQSDEYISHASDGNSFYSRIYNWVRTYSIHSKIRRIKKFKNSGTALDIGCGTGEFLHQLSQNGFTVEGIEPNEKAKTFASNKYNLQISPSLNKEFAFTHSFDLITLWHVLEHVHDLKGYIAYIHKMLSKNGVAIFALPNYLSFDATYYKAYLAAYDLPRHLYHFNKNTLARLLSQFNMEIIKSLPMKFDSYYVSMLSEKYLNRKSRNVKALLVGAKSNMIARLSTGNYSSMIYVVKVKNT